MTLRDTVDVTWRADRQLWTVEGGNGRPLVLGVVSEHATRAAALRTALDVADEHGADVRILARPAAGEADDGDDDGGGFLGWLRS